MCEKKNCWIENVRVSQKILEWTSPFLWIETAFFPLGVCVAVVAAACLSIVHINWDDEEHAKYFAIESKNNFASKNDHIDDGDTNNNQTPTYLHVDKKITRITIVK